jgi:hypothetical protein
LFQSSFQEFDFFVFSIFVELDAEYDMLLEELKDKIDDPDWNQYESEIHEAIREIEKE